MRGADNDLGKLICDIEEILTTTKKTVFVEDVDLLKV